METLTKEQIEQKKQQIAEKWEEIKALLEDLKNAGASELPDEDLQEVTGGNLQFPNLKRVQELFLKPEEGVRKYKVQSRIGDAVLRQQAEEQNPKFK